MGTEAPNQEDGISLGTLRKDRLIYSRLTNDPLNRKGVKSSFVPKEYMYKNS